MTTSIKIDDPSGIPKLLDFIHDRFFSVADVLYDRDKSTLRIPYKRELWERAVTIWRIWVLKKRRIPIVRCYLTIHNVIDYHIVDTERIGEYDFNEIGYDPATGIVAITAGIPIDMKVKVSAFEISTEETDDVVAARTTMSLF